MSKTQKFSSMPQKEYKIKDKTVYLESDIDIASGDPVVVFNRRTGATCIGTGFTSMEDIAWGITEWIGPKEGESFSVFSVEGEVTFGEEK